jgi:hypothetical protein
MGKKSWGLQLNEWVDGIVDWSFTKEELFEEFRKFGIKVPDSFENDFDNRLWKKKKRRYEK